MNVLSEQRAEGRALHTFIRTADPRDAIRAIRPFLEKCAERGSEIFDEGERGEASSLLAYWAAALRTITGRFEPTPELRPFDQENSEPGQTAKITADWDKNDLEAAVQAGFSLREVRPGRLCLPHVDLSGVDMTEADFAGADLTGAILRGSNLSGADLAGATLSGADLSRAHLRGANLIGTKLEGATLSGADCRNARLGSAVLREANIGGAIFEDSDLSGADLSRVTGIRVTFRAAQLQYSRFDGCTLQGPIFERANVSAASLTDSRFSDGNLTGCKLVGVKVNFGTRFSRCQLAGADFRTVEFVQNLLQPDSLEGSDWDRAVWSPDDKRHLEEFFKSGAPVEEAAPVDEPLESEPSGKSTGE